MLWTASCDAQCVLSFHLLHPIHHNLVDFNVVAELYNFPVSKIKGLLLKWERELYINENNAEALGRKRHFYTSADKFHFPEERHSIVLVQTKH